MQRRVVIERICDSNRISEDSARSLPVDISWVGSSPFKSLSMARSQRNTPKEKLSQKEKQKLKKEAELMRKQIKTVRPLAGRNKSVHSHKSLSRLFTPPWSSCSSSLQAMSTWEPKPLPSRKAPARPKGLFAFEHLTRITPRYYEA